MKVTGISCKSCNEFIYSRAHHDMHWCSCNSIFVDGGFSYFRCGWKEGAPPISEEREIGEVTEKELFEDWDYKHDKYGVIRHVVL